MNETNTFSERVESSSFQSADDFTKDANVRGTGFQSSGGTGINTMDAGSPSASGSGSSSGDAGSSEGAMSNVMGKADAGIEKAVSGIDSLADTLQRRGEAMGEGQLGSVATMAADRMHSGAEMLRGTDTQQLMTELENFVRQKPAESMAIALGIGFLLSKAMR